LRARVRIVAHHRWPARCEGLDRRTGEVAHAVRTVVELRAGERAARVDVTVDNRSRDHRLRAHFPLPSPAAGSVAECAFGPVARGLVAEGGPTEGPLATYPAQRFVQAGGLTVVHDGVVEYELVDLADSDGGGTTARELALTLVRAIGMLSQVPMPTRPLPAGPLVPTEGSQLQRRLTLRYAVAVGDDLDPFALADEVLVPLRVAAALVVRVFNPSDAPTRVELPGRRGWLVDLRGRPLAPFDGAFELRARGIATASLGS
jgi:hypothetical protein